MVFTILYFQATTILYLRPYKSVMVYKKSKLVSLVILVFLFSIINEEKVLGTSNRITLKQAIDIALENNHHVKSALATLPVSRAKLIFAKYRPNLTIGSNAEIVKGGSLHALEVGGEIELGKKRYWRIKLAKEEISKDELEVRKTLWEVHTEVHAVYAQLSVGLQILDLAKERSDFYKTLLDVAQKRYDAGDISRLDLIRTKAEYLKAQNQLSEFEGRLQKAKVEFNHILGREPGSELLLPVAAELKPKIKLHEHPEVKEIIKKALEKRIDIAILEKEFGIAKAKLKQARWERLPNLHIIGGPTRPSQGDNRWGPYIGSFLELPVFNRKQGEINEAKAHIGYLEKERERIEHDIKIEVANVFHELEVKEEQVHRFQSGLIDDSENILDMTKEGYKLGKLSLIDVLNTEEQNRYITESYLESLLGYRVAIAELEYAVGVPLYEFGEEL